MLDYVLTERSNFPEFVFLFVQIKPTRCFRGALETVIFINLWAGQASCFPLFTVFVLSLQLHTDMRVTLFFSSNSLQGSK